MMTIITLYSTIVRNWKSLFLLSNISRFLTVTIVTIPDIEIVSSREESKIIANETVQVATRHAISLRKDSLRQRIGRFMDISLKALISVMWQKEMMGNMQHPIIRASANLDKRPVDGYMIPRNDSILKPAIYGENKHINHESVYRVKVAIHGYVALNNRLLNATLLHINNCISSSVLLNP